MATVKREQILQEAEKLAARGKLDAAIKEYRRALELAPNDTNTLNRLGDLLVRVNRIDEAIDVYQQIAEHFAHDGFFLKAIAIYKKVNRLDPQRTQTYERLADLYFKQGLVVEGRQQLMTLADWFMRSRNLPEAVRISRRLTELEPANFQARAKLVDLLVQTGDGQAATTEIDALGRFLLGRNMIDEAVKLYHRAIELSPANGDFVAPCVDAMLGAGRGQQAVELAKKAIAATGGGHELLRAAARAHAEAGDLDTARAYLDKLMPEIGERTDVVQLYGDVMLRVGEAEEAKEILLPAVDRLLRAGDVARAATLVKRLLRSAPTDIEVLNRANRVFERMNDHDMVVTIEVALTEAYIRDGRKGEAADLHRRLLRRNPSDPAVVKRLGEMAEVLGLSAAQRMAATPSPPSTPPPAQPPSAPRSAATPAPLPPSEVRPAPEEEISVEFIDVDIQPDASLMDTGAARVDTDVWAAPQPVATPVAVSPVVAEPAAAPPSPADEMFTEAQVFAKYGLVDKAVSHLQRLLALFPDHADARSLLGSLGGEIPAEAAPASVPDLPVPTRVEAVEIGEPPSVTAAEAHIAPITFEPVWEPVPAEPPIVLEAVELPVAGPPPNRPEAEGQPTAPSQEPLLPQATPAPRPSAAQSEGVSLPLDLLAGEAAAKPTRPRKVEQAPSLSLDDIMGARTTAPGRPASAPPVKLGALEAMLGLAPSAQPPTPGRPKATPASAEVKLDLGALGLPTTPSRRKPIPPPIDVGAPEVTVVERQAAPSPEAQAGGSLPSESLDLPPAALPVEAPAPPTLRVEEVASSRATMSGSPQPSAPEPVEMQRSTPEEVEVLEAPIDLVEVQEILAGPTPEQLGELDFFIQQGLLDEAAKLLLKLREAFPDHPDVRSRHALLKARGWDEEKPAAGPEATASELFSEEEQFFDLAAELEKELAEDELVAEATGVGKGGEVSIEELFREFQRGVAEQIQEQDYDTHFNLGLAYREMGLLDEAIGEFQLALRSTELFVESASMIGACYMEKGLPEQASEWYARGLTAPRLGPESVLGLRYELGRAQEAAGRTAEALGSFTEVLAVNPAFRDVVARVSRLRTH